MMRQKFLPIAVTVFAFPLLVQAGSIPVANYSFEAPVVPFAYPYAIPDVNDWIQLDNDTDYSTNTGIFLNVTAIARVDGYQVGFLGSERGNAFTQDLPATYQAGKRYQMTVAVCVSGQYPPPDPNGLQLAFYYRDPNVVQIAAAMTLPPSHFNGIAMEDCSVISATVLPQDACIGKPVGIAIRSTGAMGGYWDLDNVRVTELTPPDLTGDSFINLADFAQIAAQWLLCGQTTADVTGDGCVDEQDLLLLTEYWLDHV